MGKKMEYGIKVDKCMAASSKTLKRAQVAKILNATCPDHPGNQHDHVCLSCDGKRICTQCKQMSHKGHSTISVTSYTKTRREELGETNVKAKQLLLDLKQKCEVGNALIKESNTTAEENVDKIKKKGAELKHLVDVVMEKIVSANEEIKERNISRLTAFLQDIESQTHELNSLVKETEDCIGSLSLEDLEHLQNLTTSLTTNNEHVEIPDVESLRMKLHNVSVQDVERLFCYMQFSKKPSKRAIQVPQTQLSDQASKASHDQDSTTKDNPHRGEQHLVYSMRTAVHEVSSFQTGLDKARSFCPMGTTSVWITTGAKALQICTQSGKQLKVVNMNADITDICLSNDEDYLWISCCDCIVTQINLATSTVGLNFRTNDYPWCLCISPDDTFLIGMHGCVASYSQKGKLLHTAQKDDAGENLFKSPYKISVSRGTGDIAIIDFKTQKLVVLDKTMNLKFRFTGHSVESKNTSTQTKETVSSGAGLQREFNPCGVIYDKNGNLVVADYGNKCVLVLNGQSGQCIRTLLRDTNQNPCSLAAVLQNGNIVVGFSGGLAKIYHYLNVEDHITKL